MSHYSEKSRNNPSALRFYFQQGMSLLTFIVFGSIFGAAFYYCYNVFPIFYGYYELENHMHSIIRLSEDMSDLDIRKRLKITIREQHIPLDPKDIQIKRREGQIEISAEYYDEFVVEFRGKEYFKQEFSFTPNASGHF